MNSKSRSNSKSPTITKLSWNNYFGFIEQLCKQLETVIDKFDFVYGIPRGGCIPAVLISHRLNEPMIETEKLKTTKKVLVIDDIVDTAKTISQIKKKYKNNISLIAAIYKHKLCEYMPDFYIVTNNCWIQFPYEKD